LPRELLAAQEREPASGGKPKERVEKLVSATLVDVRYDLCAGRLDIAASPVKIGPDGTSSCAESDVLRKPDCVGCDLCDGIGALE
jgi:hypothetical protein